MTDREAWDLCIRPAGGERRVFVVACAAKDSGVPAHWAAGPATPGIALLPDPAIDCVDKIRARIAEVRHPGDVLVISIHWGGNWGYEVPGWQRELAHAFVETCHADVVFGHSSHHPKAAELYRGRLILYGCGDLINDYEGIGGHENYPTGIAVGYFVDIDTAGERSVTCRMRPYEIRRFRLERPGTDLAANLADILGREYARMKIKLVRDANGDLLVTAPPP
jgi:poly-gamma-glutamate synthesis protein (capsule biosynthesis protein)